MSDRDVTEDHSSDEPVEAPLEPAARALAEPFREFVSAQSSSSWILLFMTAIAVGMSNSIWQSQYFSFVHTEFGLTFGEHTLHMSLQHWVSEGLMAIFFFLLGLELKRELLAGQLSEPQRASAVLFAALGGMLLPALFFLLLASVAPLRDGWGIPVATDTAFALMVLIMLGRRVPVAARAFLVGFAIVDDLGAILIITFAYTAELNTAVLGPVALVVCILLTLNLVGVRKALPYAIAGGFLWLLFQELGVHGTIAGVIVALTAPVRPAISRQSFVERLQRRLREFRSAHDESTETIFEQPRQQALALDVLEASEKATAPLRRWESGLQGPVSYFVMPVFVLMNAGVALTGPADSSGVLSLAIAGGLLIGKPLGIVLGVWISTRLGVAQLPESLTWRHLVGIGLLGAVGFTMSLFIATLSFGESTALLDTAKQSIMATSLVAGALGYAWLRWGCPSPR